MKKALLFGITTCLLITQGSCGSAPTEKQNKDKYRKTANYYLNQPCMKMSYSETQMRVWSTRVNDSTTSESELIAIQELLLDKLATAAADSAMQSEMNK